MNRAVVTVAGLLLVAGCSSGGATHESARPSPTVATTSAAPKFDSAAAIGKTIGCRTPLRIDSQSIAQEERYCKVGQHLVSIVRAADPQALQAYADMGQAFGANIAIISDNWAVASMSRSLVQRLAKQNHWRVV